MAQTDTRRRVRGMAPKRNTEARSLGLWLSMIDRVVFKRLILRS